MRRYLLIMLFFLAACGAPETVASPTAAAPTAVAAADPCGDAVLQPYRGSYNGIIDRWSTAAIRAGNTQAADLQAPITELQKIADDLSTLKPPACAQAAQDGSLKAMRMAIDGYQSLLAHKDAGATIRESIDLLETSRQQINALPGQPAPTPTNLPTSVPAPTYTPIPSVTPTLTPSPTSTPLPTATPEPRKGVLRNTTQVFETPDSNTPVKTLLKGTSVLVFEFVKSRIHIRAGKVEGWVNQGSVVVQ